MDDRHDRPGARPPCYLAEKDDDRQSSAVYTLAPGQRRAAAISIQRHDMVHVSEKS